MSSKNIEKFSVLMSVYAEDNDLFFEQALNSIFNQSLKADEVVLVCDGPLSKSLENVISNFLRNESTFKVFNLERNSGLPTALNYGLKFITNDLIIRCDADDINRINRFERLILQFPQNPNHAVLGSYVMEFSDNLPNRLRKVPLSIKQCKNMIGKRNPINHPSVIFRKSLVLKVGGYSESLEHAQDYELWAKLIAHGYYVSNTSDVLVEFRTSENQLKRRGGLKYIRFDFILMRSLLGFKLLKLYQCPYFIATRVAARLIPGKLKRVVYNIVR